VSRLTRPKGRNASYALKIFKKGESMKIKINLNGAKGKYYDSLKFDKPIIRDTEGKGRRGSRNTRKEK